MASPPSPPNPLYAWLIDRGCWISSGQDRSCSHVFLDGGKAFVSPELAREFARVYSRSLRDGVPQYAVEQRTPVFRLFIDIDLQNKVALDECMVDKICAKAYECAKSFFFPTTSSMVACTAPPRLLPSKGTVKNGIHLHWPEIYVTASKALTFRSFCINEMSKEFGQCFCNSWEDIIDAAVFRSSGLRMLGSCKKGIPGTYFPYRVFESGGTTEKIPALTMLDNLEHWLELTSIRVTNDLQRPKDSTDETFESVVLKSDLPGNIRRIKTTEIQDIVEQFYSVVPKTFYKNLKVTSAYEVKTSASAKVSIYILGTNCMNCMNKRNGKHRSNHVYFLINKNGVHQKCFCRCDTLEGRIYTQCKDFVGKVANLTPAMAKALGMGDRPSQSSDRGRPTVNDIACKILESYK